MSHYPVMVICDTPAEAEALLAPYQENNMCDCPREFLEFTDIEQEYREKYENGTATFVHTKEGRLLLPWDDEFKKPGRYGYGSETHEDPEGSRRVEIPYTTLYDSFEEYMHDWCGEEKDEETGCYGYWENPNAHWDWYQFGGRWKDFLKAKDGTHCSCGNISELDFSFDEEEAELARKRWKQAVDGIDQELDCWLWDKQWYEKFYGDIETYAKCEGTFYVRSVITPDGEWHTMGEMGWFGVSFETPEEKRAWIDGFEENFILPYEDRHVFIVDCHI